LHLLLSNAIWTKDKNHEKLAEEEEKGGWVTNV